MRNVCAVALMAALIAVPSLGMAETSLTPGSAAGVKKAQLESPVVIVAVVAAVGIGIGLAVSGDSSGPTVPPASTPVTPSST